MCATCGCGADDVRVTALVHTHGGHDQEQHSHGGASHPHSPGGQTHVHRSAARGEAAAASRTVLIEQDILSRNDQLAARNRAWLAARGAVAVNLMSSPGSGKTTLLERTVGQLSTSLPVCVVEGDQETLLDAERIRATGCPVVQVNTGSGCHLDASMVQRALVELDPARGALVFVENVGNLVCPALFDLGETRRVVVMSVTEGVDKPLKYPQMFAAADLIVVNKTDLLPYVDFDLGRCADNLGKVNPRATIAQVSATRGDGLDSWYAWLEAIAATAATAGETPRPTMSRS